jgi:GDP-L-fucose synthase
VGYEGSIGFDVSKPDGSPRKWMDSGRLNRLGWNAKIGLDEGLRMAYKDMLSR